MKLASHPDDEALGRQAIGNLINDQPAALEPKLAAQIRPQLAPQFPKMRAALPFDGITGITLVDAGWLSTKMLNGSSVRNARLTFELVGGNEYAVAEVQIRRDNADALITSFNVRKIDRPVSELNAFRLSDISFVNFAIMIWALAALVTIGLAIRRIWTSGAYRRRWLWISGCLLGVGKVTTIWSTVYFTAQPLFIQLLCFAAIRPGLLAPWQLSASIPVLAIWVLVRRRTVASEQDAVEAEQP